MCTWSGQLPPRRYMNPTYSPRVFLGGVPWDITESSLMTAFQPFGSLVVDWPGKEGKHARHPPKGESSVLDRPATFSLSMVALNSNSASFVVCYVQPFFRTWPPP